MGALAQVTWGEADKRLTPSLQKLIMSKIPTERLREVITGIVAASAEKKRKFLETIELQAVLKNYDVNKDKRFAGSIKLPNIPRPNLSVCILGDAYHVEEAQKSDVPNMDVEALKALNKDKKKVLTIGVAVANVELTEQQIYANVQIAVNFLVSLLKKNWQNVKTLHVKSTMGGSNRIY